MGGPTHIVEIGTGDSASDGDAQRGVAGQRRMDAGRIVIGLEVGELSFEVSWVPEQHMVEKFSPRCTDQPLHKRMGQWHMGHGFDFIDLENPKIRLPAMVLEQRA